ncbi:MAG: GIY-YIG nuclease family protein [Verrucomicrobia bacterium]|nr:GIY-YIG nuclease family protein [Verrucomicrobiota bacterium]
MEEIVYILTNACMPGLVKIGVTATSIDQRIKELSNSTAVPLPFTCYYAAVVTNGKFVERQLQEAFGNHRISPKREFFQIDANRVKAALLLVAVREVTPQNDPEEIAELKEYGARRPPFRFSLAQVPIGAELRFVRDENIVCKVVDDRNVEFQGEVKSLSAIASELLSKVGWKSTQVQGPIYWLYEGETLEERRQRIEVES